MNCFLKTQIGNVELDLSGVKARLQLKCVASSLPWRPKYAEKEVSLDEDMHDAHLATTSPATRPSLTAPTISGKRAFVIAGSSGSASSYDSVRRTNHSRVIHSSCRPFVMFGNGDSIRLNKVAVGKLSLTRIDSGPGLEKSSRSTNVSWGVTINP